VAELLEYLSSILFTLWIALVVVAYVRFDKLKHGRPIFILSLIWPFLLFEDLLRMVGMVQWLSPFVGLFYFVPVLMMVALFLTLHPMLTEKPLAFKPLMYLAVGLVIAAQIPVLLLPGADKIALLFAQPVGQPLNNLPVYLAYGLSGFAIIGIGISLVETMRDYQNTLSEQVVDVNYYKMPAIIGLFASIVGIAFFAIVMTAIVAFDFIQFSYWQTTIHYSYAAVMLLILILLLERRRYSPMPLDLNKLGKKTGNENQLRDILGRAEKVMIERKAYKVIGLRIRQFADAANIDPTDLALASHVLLNRNFRAYVYHYRLEYAKKVLMATDVKVSSVAKRLGFNSEKFLSDVFVKYIESMADQKGNEFIDPLKASLKADMSAQDGNLKT
jgi:AraC-like DNA-binding protein